MNSLSPEKKFHTQGPLTRLFLPTELVFTCGPIRPGLGPTHTSVGTLDTPPNLDDVFFAINPLASTAWDYSNPDKPVGPRRSNNVSIFRNFLLEIDTRSLEEQHTLLTRVNEIVPVALGTYSGSKSIHMIVSLLDNLPAHEAPILFYKTVWKALAETIEEQLGRGPLFDRACQDPARLSRLPGACEPGRKKQELVHTGGFISWEALSTAIGSRLRTVRATLPSAVEDPNMSVQTFESELRARMSLSNLRMKFTAPQAWAASAGMYGELFRLTLWAIDSTGVPQNTLLCYLNEKVFPIVRAAGYPRDLERPVLNAYEHKQR